MKRKIIFLLGVISFLSGCGQQSESLCSDDLPMRHLKFDFGYELVSDTAAPQLNILAIKQENSSNNMVWCSAKAELKGPAYELVRALELRLGAKKWRQMESSLARQNWSVVGDHELSRIKDSVALYLLSTHKNELLSPKQFTLPVEINYLLEKRNSSVEKVEFSPNLNVEALKLVHKELEFSSSENDLVSRILR